MQKQHKGQFLIFAGILTVSLAAWFIYRKLKKNKEAALTSGGYGGYSGSGSTSAPKGSFPLKKGSSGALVKQLQQALLAQGGKLPKYGADGKFGSETEAALKSLYKSTSVTDQTMFDYITKLSGKNPSAGSGLDYPINKPYVDSIGLKF